MQGLNDGNTCMYSCKKVDCFLNLPILGTQVSHLLYPGVNDRLYLWHAHQGQGHIGLGTEAHYAARTACSS
jgi:hypothetical protein